MGRTIVVKYEDNTIELEVNNYPDTCPLCHTGINPLFIGGCVLENSAEAIFQCPRLSCNHLFIGYYYENHATGMSRVHFYLDHVEPINYEPQEFGKIVNSVSKDFVKIYNQSEQAEGIGLSEIAGPGFRKSLEFLIKDYVISKIPDKKEEIIILPLGKVISDHIDDHRIQDIAKRAAWVGNDETHYYRKWPDKDINRVNCKMD